MTPEIVRLPIGDKSPEARLYYGQHAIETLRSLPDASVQTVCTSPPYWGLRVYGKEIAIWGGDPDCDHDWSCAEGYTGHRGSKGQVPQTKWKDTDVYPQNASGTSQSVCSKCGAWRGSLGLEPTPDLYVEHLVMLFEEVRRVLHPSGTLWLNLGDSYMSHPANNLSNLGGFTGDRVRKDAGFHDSLKGAAETRKNPKASGLKDKDLVGIPWRVALALQAAGWYLRSDIIWAKGNPMPESVRDRPTSAHEHVFLLAHPDSGGRYFYDSDAVKEPASANPDTAARNNRADDHNAVGTAGLYGTEQGQSGTPYDRPRSSHEHVFLLAHPDSDGHYFFDSDAIKETSETGDPRRPYGRGQASVGGRPASGTRGDAGTHDPAVRNKRNVWHVNTRPYPGAHFACWPPDLVEPMIKAGSSERGCCPHCNAPWKRLVDATPNGGHWDTDAGKAAERGILGHTSRAHGASTPSIRTTVGWGPTCDCPEHDPVPCVVLDPFSGSGTTGMVSLKLGRHYIGLDAIEDFLPLAKARILGNRAPSTDPVEKSPVEDLFG